MRNWQLELPGILAPDTWMTGFGVQGPKRLGAREEHGRNRNLKLHQFLCQMFYLYDPLYGVRVCTDLHSTNPSFQASFWWSFLGSNPTAQPLETVCIYIYINLYIYTHVYIYIYWYIIIMYLDICKHCELHSSTLNRYESIGLTE